MLKFEPGARAYLSGIKALSTDKDDKVVFVGLTAAESVWYADYLEASFSGTADRSDGPHDKYLALQDRHEAARQAVIANESFTQTEKPPIQ